MHYLHSYLILIKSIVLCFTLNHTPFGKYILLTAIFLIIQVDRPLSMKKPCIRTRNRRPGGNKARKMGSFSGAGPIISPINGHVASAFANTMPLFTYPHDENSNSLDPNCHTLNSPYLAKPELSHFKLPFHFPGVVHQFHHDPSNGVTDGVATAVNPVSPMDYKPSLALQAYGINS